MAAVFAYAVKLHFYQFTVGTDETDRYRVKEEDIADVCISSFY